MIAKLRRVLIAAKYRPVDPAEPTPSEIHIIRLAWQATAAQPAKVELPWLRKNDRVLRYPAGAQALSPPGGTCGRWERSVLGPGQATDHGGEGYVVLKLSSLARTRKLTVVYGLAGALLSAQVWAASAAPAAVTAGWPQYMRGPLHDSVSRAMAFTPSNAGSVRRVWHWQPPAIAGEPPPNLDASPTAVAGRVYIGAESGGFYALDEATGVVVWSTQLDTEPAVTCDAEGITSTAAVQPDPVTGATTVYVSGARYLYALDAATGAIIWKTRIGPADKSTPDAYYNWSSPTVVGGHIYVGLASSCDRPLIRGGVVELDQHTGQVLHTWHSVPAGSIGGSVWSSVAASRGGKDLWVSTGNECTPPLETCPAGNEVGRSLSILHMSASLKVLQAWQVPGATGHNRDFGSSPTLFGTGTTPPDVGACNKNGTYYALAAKPLGSSPLWADTIGIPGGQKGACLASAVWDGKTGALYLSSNNTTIGTTSYGGSIRRVDPRTGAYLWETGLPCTVVGTPTLDSAGVLAAGTRDGCLGTGRSGAYLIDASTGAILNTLPVGRSHVFGQPIFDQHSLLVATETRGLFDFAPS
jgi:outer membrane protein assembly factor BamB